MSAIEVLDSCTEGHGKRVSDFSTSLARRLGLEAAEVSEISTASLLHDIGKLGVPSEILLKPAGLDRDEYDLVKKHPEYSARILSQVHGFEYIVDLALRHHERYDGMDYPDGLAGDAIPLGAQIIQLADCFDDMTSSRSCRPALSLGLATRDIREESGRQFNYAVAEAAIEIFAERRAGRG